MAIFRAEILSVNFLRLLKEIRGLRTRQRQARISRQEASNSARPLTPHGAPYRVFPYRVFAPPPPPPGAPRRLPAADKRAPPARHARDARDAGEMLARKSPRLLVDFLIGEEQPKQPEPERLPGMPGMSGMPGMLGMLGGNGKEGNSNLNSDWLIWIRRKPEPERLARMPAMPGMLGMLGGNGTKGKSNLESDWLIQGSWFRFGGNGHATVDLFPILSKKKQQQQNQTKSKKRLIPHVPPDENVVDDWIFVFAVREAEEEAAEEAEQEEEDGGPRVHRVRQSAGSDPPEDDQARLRVHADGGRRDGPGQIDAGQHALPHRPLQGPRHPARPR